MQKRVPCWYRMAEPKCPANTWTGECPLWSKDSYTFHIPHQRDPAKCPLSGRPVTLDAVTESERNE